MVKVPLMLQVFSVIPLANLLEVSNRGNSRVSSAASQEDTMKNKLLQLSLAWIFCAQDPLQKQIDR